MRQAFLLSIILSFSPLLAEEGSPVTFRGREIFRITQHAGFLKASERAQIVTARLNALPENFAPLKIEPAEAAYNIVSGDTILFQVLPADAAESGITTEQLARNLKELMESRLRENQAMWLPETFRQEQQLVIDFLDRYLNRTLIQILLAVLLLLLLLLVRWFFLLVVGFLLRKLEQYKEILIRHIAFRGREIISRETIYQYIVYGTGALRFLLIVLLYYYFSGWILDTLPLDTSWDLRSYLRGVVHAALLTVVVLAVYRNMRSVLNTIASSRWILEQGLLRDVRFQDLVVLGSERLLSLFHGIIRLSRFLLTLTVIYFYVVFFLGFFPITRGLNQELFAYVMQPVSRMVLALIAYAPNLFLLVLIAVSAFYAIRFARFFFTEIQAGKISLPGFFPDWALPTHRIVSFIIIAFAAIIMFPYLPGSDSEAFKGVSLFIGFLVSLSSSTVLANVVAGLVVTYTRPFAVGDRVKIADTVGDITSISLLVTRIKTTKNVEITIPNGMVLASHIINYSAGARAGGVVLHTSVTIGYDVPSAKVEGMLVEAAIRTGRIMETPAPYVLQTSLEDFYVSYEINAFTEHPESMATIYSDLHRNIQHVFFENGVEILSPHYRAVRGGADAAIPPGFVPADFERPSIPVESVSRQQPGKGSTSRRK